MKKIILLAACFFAVSSINAQEVPTTPKPEKAHIKKGGPKLTTEQRAQKSVDNLNSEVTLTDEQKTKIKELALARVTAIDAIRDKYKGQSENKEVVKAEMQTVRKEYHKNAKALLTAEQLEKLKVKHKELKAAGKKNALETND